jgi:Tol biopolymer transport system component/tRNA A-37 threonylcarbamoyl transferase component Bud32
MSSLLSRLSIVLAERYRIEREIGAGGMATVYLAHDLRHDRRVAVKVLRPELAAVIGAERFLAEIKLTANLQHPHILPLFDSGAADSFLFYVMPFIEGEPLRERLRREKQLPVDEAVRIAREVASALDYAHRHGVVHRDIKPENILLHDGRALVADFGIALAASKAGGDRMTETGMSLGTPHYMSPEQAMGEREITARSDVYALGAVLYEMLTGDPPFTGSTAQAVVARVVTETPRPMLPQRHTIPPHVEAAVLTALEKLPADRFATAAQFADALDDSRRTSGRTQATVVAAPSLRDGRRRNRWAGAAVALALVAVGAWGWARAFAGSRQAAAWQYVSLGDSVALALTVPAMALTPDGSSLVFKDERQNGRLWIKRRGALDPTPIAGTERARNPAFSPDGEWVAFVADGRVKKVRAAGGATITLADSVDPAAGGVAWLDDGTLVFISPTGQGLRRVNEGGGPATVVMPDAAIPGGGGITAPHALPGGRGVLFSYCTATCLSASVHLLDLRSNKEKLLLDDVIEAWHLATGHLLYVRRDGVAMVAPFDLGELEITGPAVPALEDVQVNSVYGFAPLAVSASGSLVYVRGTGAAAENTIVRVSRAGDATPFDTTWYGEFNSFALSPDGSRLAVSARGVNGLNIWVKQLERGPFTRLTFGGTDRRPLWSPDGLSVAFIHDSASTSVVYVRPADGSGQERLLVAIDRQIQEAVWSRDARTVVVRTDNAAAGAGDLLAVRVGEDSAPAALVATPLTELHPALSPDGRWLAYTSNQSGFTNEVYVRSVGERSGGRWQVSNGGGSQPVWAPHGRELFFLDGRARLIAAQIQPGTTFAVGDLIPLFDAARFARDEFHQSYEVTPDGRSFLFALARRQPGGSASPRLVWVDHWFSDLKERLR